MEEKTCTKCRRCLKLSAFAWKNKKDGRLASECKECHSKVRKAYYKANRKVEIENAMRTKKVRLPRLKEEFRQFKAKLKCSRCDEDHPAALHFHHTDPTTKDMSVARCVANGWSFDAIMAEVAKCDVLCANCHAKEHYKRA